MAAAPFSVLMSTALYFVMTRMMPPEVKNVAGGKEAIGKALADTWSDQTVREAAAGDLAYAAQFLGD